MKSTPNVNGASTNGADVKNVNGAKGAGFSIKPGAIQNVGDLIREAKEKNPDAIKEPTTYPAAPQPAPATKPEPAPTAQTEPAPQPAKPEPAQKETVIFTAPKLTALPVRSRGEEIEYQIEKSRKLQLINNQLQSLKGKLSELKQFSYAVDKDEDFRYGRIVIYDDQNREFTAKNHGLAALVVENLKRIFEEKIAEKEEELLTVSQS